jgi:hypothetical protein
MAILFSSFVNNVEGEKVHKNRYTRFLLAEILGSSFFFLAKVGCPFEFPCIPFEHQGTFSTLT